MKKITIGVLLLFVCLGINACNEKAKTHSSLEKLIIDVFDPQPGEQVLVMVDLPDAGLSDHALWSERREMAKEWQNAFEGLAEELEIDVYPLLTYPATGAHNGLLPSIGEMDGQPIVFDEIMAETNIVVALTEFSATAPLFAYTGRLPDLRAASMPGVSRSMEDTALAADYGEVARKCAILAERLDKADGAHLEFSTGHEIYIDLRYRNAYVDDGQLHAGKKGERVINLPSGETYIAPYEGELVGQPSETAGIVPLPISGDDFVPLQIKENRVVEVVGEGSIVNELRQQFSINDGRRNLAELGLGCNEMAIVTGNVLEDEKVMGVHLASGLSEHIGGTVGVDDFIDPKDASHMDRVYPFGANIEVTGMILNYEDGSSEAIIENSRYTVFDTE